MTKRILLSAVVILSIGIFLVISRWPRIEPHLVQRTGQQHGPDVLELEYRMRQPFQVALAHKLSERFEAPEGTGIFVGSPKVVRKEQVAVFKPDYDFLHDEYYVRFQLTKKNGLRIDGPSGTTEVSVWCGKNSRSGKFVEIGPHGDRVFFGEGVGQFVLRMDAGEGLEEIIIAYAGTNVEEWSH